MIGTDQPDMTWQGPAPVCIGGLGGSGTRVIAGLLQGMGWFLGHDLNDSLDNLWYVLLFGRRNILLADDAELNALAALYYRQMSAPDYLDDEAHQRLKDCLATDRIQHNAQFLQEAYDSMLSHAAPELPKVKWGWKVPYTYILLDRLMRFSPQMRYIHITRGGINMAYSHNQNQLAKWGPVLLNRDVTVGPTDSLSFWCAVHRKITRLAQQYPRQILHVNFETLIAQPQQAVSEIAHFMGVDLTAAKSEQLCHQVRRPKSIGREQKQDLSQFRREDMDYVRQVSML